MYVSDRCGITEDSSIPDLAVVTNCGQIKIGSTNRTDRMVKYNQLLRIEERLGRDAVFLGVKTFKIWSLINFTIFKFSFF